MNQVAARFELLRRNRRKALIPYLMGGDPGLRETADLLTVLSEAGADLIEVGVPFSDPVADGPIIQAAGQRALNNGCTVAKLLATLKEVLPGLGTPVILMAYYNTLYHRGIERFMAEARESGVAGLIIPDLPPEEAGDLRQYASEYEIGLNFLVAPTSPAERIRQAAEASTGFLYAVSLKGVTGVRNQLPAGIPDFIARIRTQTSKPVGVGFGISTPEQARSIGQLADGVIVGSAIVQAIAEDSSFQKVTAAVRNLKEGLAG
jgi:tryptophan synthase alpha chain